MTRRRLLIVIGVNLLVLVGLAFAYPHLMVAPGPLMPAHAALTTDCFGCHAPLRGASAERCVACHAVADIGLRTTTGRPVAAAAKDRSDRAKPPFHQSLIEPDCTACHTDHTGPLLERRHRSPFSHALLQTGVRTQCSGCHAAPADVSHRDLGTDCAQCHTAAAWKPATFDHDTHFRLDGEHRTACVTCHLGNDYQAYTCYGCHAHTPSGMLAKHREEGIRSVDDCASCHRSAHGEPERHERGGDGSGGRDATKQGDRTSGERD